MFEGFLELGYWHAFVRLYNKYYQVLNVYYGGKRRLGIKRHTAIKSACKGGQLEIAMKLGLGKIHNRGVFFHSACVGGNIDIIKIIYPEINWFFEKYGKITNGYDADDYRGQELCKKWEQGLQIALEYKNMECAKLFINLGAKNND